MTDKEFLKALKTRIYYGMIRDGENESWIADEAVLKNGNIYLTFTDYGPEEEENEFMEKDPCDHE